MACEKYVRYQFAIDDSDSDLQAISTDLLGRNRNIRMDIIRQSVLTAFLLYKDVDIVELCTKTDVRNPLNSALSNTSQSSQFFELRWYSSSDLFVHTALGMVLKELNPIYRGAYILVLFVLGYRILQGKVGISDVAQLKMQNTTQTNGLIDNDITEVIKNEPVISAENVEPTKNVTAVTSGDVTKEQVQSSNSALRKETKMALGALMKRSS